MFGTASRARYVRLGEHVFAAALGQRFAAREHGADVRPALGLGLEAVVDQARELARQPSAAADRLGAAGELFVRLAVGWGGERTLARGRRPQRRAQAEDVG